MINSALPGFQPYLDFRWNSRMESKLARELDRALVEATQRLTPEERLNAFLTHCELMIELHRAGEQAHQARANPTA